MIMNKKTLTIVVAVIVVLLLVGLGVYLNKSKPSGNQPAKESTPAETLIENATKGTLPSLETNPLENKPDLNPADKANPFTDIKTNPFK